MKERSKRANAKIASGDWLSNFLFWTPLALLVVLPMAFSTALPAAYSLPKFVLLLVASSVIALLLAINAGRANPANISLFKANQVKLVCLYLVIVALSTIFAVAPRVSLFGSNGNFMGLLTRLCFLVCFFGLIAGIGRSETRLQKTLWAMAISGGVVAAYAVLQFFGIDPFASASVYTFSSSLGNVIRVCSSIGHSNYLGNFLLYIAPMSAGLALATNKKERLLAASITALALLAILLSVARGAWVGIFVGLIFFVILEAKPLLAKQTINKKRLLPYALISLAGVLVVIGLIAFSPASRSLKERTQTLIKEGVSSSGRLLLWRDSLKMLPAYPLTGVGSEGFRKAFLAYKSKEVTKLSQPNNNESPHNAYLDVAISYGLFGLALYLAIIFASLRTLIRARRRAPSPNWRIILSGILASFAAVLAHNFFIFDQLSTGLYFFAFLALAPALTNVFAAPEQVSQAVRTDAKAETLAAETPAVKSFDAETPAAKPGPQPKPAPASGLRLWASRSLIPLAAFSVVISLWYCAGLLEAELAFKNIFDPKIAGNFQAIAGRCEQVAASPLPTKAYHFMVGRALETYAKSLQALATSQGQPGLDKTRLADLQRNALQLAIGYVEQSLAHTNTPDLNYTTLASLALLAGDTDRLRFAATEAVKCDPYNYQARWLMAEAFLADGETEAAVREAEAALEFYPDYPNAASVLVRAHNQDRENAANKLQKQLTRPPNGKGHTIEELIEYARQLTRQGNLQKARRKFLMAIVRSPGNCPDCHRELAVVYEKLGLYRNAIFEWQTFAQQTPERAAVEQVATHIESLKQNSPVKP